MQTTTHYDLQKPDPNDTYNKTTDNGNMDAIDAQMYANAQAASAAQTAANNAQTAANAAQTVVSNYDVAASSPDANGKYLVTTYTRVSDASKYMVSTLSGNPDANGNYPTMTNVFYKADGVTVDHTDTWTLAYDVNGLITQRTVVTS